MEVEVEAGWLVVSVIIEAAAVGVPVVVLIVVKGAVYVEVLIEENPVV